ncbi:UNVERIFIED_CONTAM: hypothetical protein FKN15_003789 [Acipenser sinensis]
MAASREAMLSCVFLLLWEQHTHLSVTFVVQGGGGARGVAREGGSGHDVRDIISIGRDLGVYPGRGGVYERRYAEGGVSVEKRRGQSEEEGDFYSLRIESLQPSDSGAYFCKVSQWIHDPEGSWERIAQRTVGLGNVVVQPITDSGVYRCAVSVYTGQAPPTGTPAASQRSRGVNVSLRTKAVTVTAQAGLALGPPLNRGHTFSLLCNISIATTGPAQAEVKWLVMPVREGEEEPGEGRLLALLRHDGTSRLYSNGSDVSVDRPAPSSYRLRIHRAGQEDQGLYRCQVEVWGMDQHGGWFNTGAHSHSNTVRVYMYSLASDLLFIPIIVGVATAVFVGVVIVASVTCCFMKRLARKGSRK